MRHTRRHLIAGSALTILAAPFARGFAARAQGDIDQEFAHPEWFADLAWLQDNLGNDDLAIVALTPEEDFLGGHIPGSAQIDWPALEIVETSDEALMAWRPEVEAILTDLGIERGDTVVVYDGGTFIAARLWWILHQLGHEDVRILNGGLEAWAADGGELETGASTVTPAAEAYVGTPIEAPLVQIAEAEAALDQPGVIFLDVRRFDDEYAVGHIPGAINIPFMANAVADGPKYWKSAAELREMYEEAGVTPDQTIIAYCASGVRSAVTYFTLKQLGYDDVALFTGSWIEWSADPDRPVATDDAA